MLKCIAAALTDQGIKRTENQDNFFISPDLKVFAVADGMGGALGGATASLLTVEAVKAAWKDKPDNLSEAKEIHDWLVETVNAANDSVYATSTENPAVKGMGTTIVLAYQSDDRHLHIAHVGDSRAYLIRDGKCTVLTQDHSLVMELYRSGHLTEEQMRESPFKNYITRCVGHRDRVEVDETPRDLQANDWIILCTDGLTAVLSDEEIALLAENADSPESACKIMVEKTLSGGAPDNVTIIAIKYYEDEPNSKN